MLRTPGAPSKTSKRGSALFKKLIGGTAPNTPDDDGIDGVKVMANEYDPSQDLEALAKRNVPFSPMRGNDNPPNFRDGKSEEEKKESEQDQTTTAAAGVDVVNKTLALFDDLCAVPPKPAANTSSSNGSHTVCSSKNSKKDEFRHPEWGQEPSLDEDETVTNPSIQSESSEPYSSTYTSSTSMMYKESRNNKPRGIIPKSPSQNHENFEVVLDPTSLQSDSEDDGDGDKQSDHKNSKGSFSKQRRWPFAGSSTNKGKESATALNSAVKQAVAAAFPPPIAEEELTEATSDPLIPDVNLAITEEQQQLPENAEVTVEVTAAATFKKTDPKKSIVKRLGKTCIKLIAKAGTGAAAPTIMDVKQHHRAEVDSDAQHARSLEEKQDREDLPQPDDEPPVEVDKSEVEEEDTTEGAPQAMSSTTDVWNSIVASIAGKFDPNAASETVATADDSPIAEGVTNEGEESLDEVKELPENKIKAGAGAKNRSASGRVKSKPKCNSSGGRNLLKSIKKSAKSLVLPAKQEKVAISTITARQPEATKQAASTSAEVAEEVLLEKPKAFWKAVDDKGTGKMYYYHRATRETTWTKPKELEQYEADLKKWKATKALKKEVRGIATTDKNPSPAKAGEQTEIPEANRPSSPRVASWPSVNPTSKTSDDAKEIGVCRRPGTPPARAENSIVLTIADPTAKSKKQKADEIGNGEQIHKNWEERNEVERLLKSLPLDDSRPSLEMLMRDYAGREEVLLKELRAKVEALPLDETRPFDEPLNMEARKRSLRMNPPLSPHRLNQRTATFMSKASATTRSSALTDRTEKVKNTGKGKMSPFVPINETLSSATSISSRNEDDHFVGGAVPPAGRIPSRVPVPRERQLMVEELTDSRISAESYEGGGGKRGRIVRGRERPVPSYQLDTVYDGDNDTEEDNTTYDNDTYGTDSVSALSENDTDFLHRKDNFEQARRRALDDAIEREDWDLAAALSEGMRAANLPGGYVRAHSSWNQSELDKFIANNDWSAVKNYIARMREKSHANKNIGARSQLQHKELMSESSWTSDSQSSYESYDSESEI